MWWIVLLCGGAPIVERCAFVCLFVRPCVFGSMAYIPAFDPFTLLQVILAVPVDRSRQEWSGGGGGQSICSKHYVTACFHSCFAA